VWLLPQVGVVDPVAEAKFSLDSSVGDEGSNFSAGERQLLALCRALVNDSNIIVLVSRIHSRVMDITLIVEM
jgi:ABC-type multidrug transport system fused ATPase/permease subunit